MFLFFVPLMNRDVLRKICTLYKNTIGNISIQNIDKFCYLGVFRKLER